MEERREPYGYVGEEAPDPIVLLPDEGRVAVVDPGMEVVVRIQDYVAFDEALEAAAQQKKETASVILVVSGTAEITNPGSEPARLEAGHGVLWRGEELGHLVAVGGPVVYFQVEGRRLQREHFEAPT
jgi:hypothetical protein